MMTRILKSFFLAAALTAPCAAEMPDPREVVLVVNRDSNDVTFISTQTHKMVGRVHLGDFMSPHMAMFTHDGRHVVVTGTTGNTIFLVDYQGQKVAAEIDAGVAPEHMDISPDGRTAYIGNIEGGSVSVIDIPSGKEIRRIEGFAEPHNLTFTPDGAKVYVSNLGAHWVGVVDAKRHELLKKIHMPTTAPTKLNPDRYLGEIQGIINVTLTRDGRYGYAADGDMNNVSIIDTRNDEIVKTLLIGEKPWRAFVSPKNTMWIPTHDDESISVVNTETMELVATLEAGPDVIGVNFSNGKAYAISSSSSMVYIYDEQKLLPAGRLFLGKNVTLETAATDAAGEKIYLCASNTNNLYEIDGKTDAFRKIPNVGLFPWGSHLMMGQDNYCH